jgi:hypothetical protein
VPVDNILTRFDVSDQQTEELRAQHRKTARRGSGARGGPPIGAIAMVIGAAVVVAARAVLRALNTCPLMGLRGQPHGVVAGASRVISAGGRIHHPQLLIVRAFVQRLRSSNSPRCCRPRFLA